MNYRIIKDHKPTDPDGLTGVAGEHLEYERRPTPFEGWLWCRNSQGQESWTPEAWLRLDGNQAVLLRDYSARELSVNPGDVVTVELTQNEWALGVTKNGERGWLPLECLEKIE